jgi:protein SCO1/2
MSLHRHASHFGAPIAAALLLWSCSAALSAPAFTLIDDGGHAWSLPAQRGTAVVLTFGFTHCADTCPATLAKLSHLAATVRTKSPVEIAFVTVDPQRDSRAAMHRFVSRFETGGARVVGLTGTPAQIDAVMSAYHVWAQRVPGAHRNGAYDVAHSAVVYFIDARGTIAGLHDDDDPDAVLARALAEAAS